jgi:hypothetical protein
LGFIIKFNLNSIVEKYRCLLTRESANAAPLPTNDAGGG